MRHRKSGRNLGHSAEHRKAMMRNLATSLIMHERIRTTEAKAKELRSYVEKLVTLAKKGDLNSRRIAAKKVFEKEAVQKLFSDLGPRFEKRPGGYTRIYREGFRPGDNAAVSIIEFLADENAVEAQEESAE